MDKKLEVYSVMSQRQYEVDDKLIELNYAKDNYREFLVEESINNILKVLEEDGKLTERDLKIFLSDLSIRTKQLYCK